MNQIKKQKDDIRLKYSTMRREIPADEKLRRDQAICNAAAALVSFRYADYILLYSAMENEIDISPLALTALERGKKVGFPISDKETHTMVYRLISSLDELKPGAYGILEPPAENEAYDPEKSQGGAVCFVPGLVYDRAGYRLGYGKGFYDRYLSEFHGCSIGVVYSDYILPTVPRGRYDMSVNILLTEKGVKVVNEA